jgi:hypothetical protein
MATWRVLGQALPIVPRQRIIIDNDFAGDPDGLVQLAHHMLCSSVEVRLIIGSHLHDHEAWLDSPDQAAQSAAKATELLEVLGTPPRTRVVAGAEHALAGMGRPTMTPAAEAIIREALRSSADTPLYYAAGAGLTDLATALLIEPRIARRLKLVWVGGPEYQSTPRPPGPPEPEYNLTIDKRAAQVIFGRSDIDIWQVPRSSYRQMIVSYQELLARVRPAGAVGEYLVGNIERVMRLAASLPAPHRINLGETYILGDSPLVTLTALQSPFQPDPSSSAYELRPRLAIDDKGGYGKPTGGRPIRVYTHIDSRLTLEDLYARLMAHAREADRAAREKSESH